MQARDFKTIAELREAFPSAFLANGSVDFSGQSGIRTLPRDMIVDGQLFLDDCSNLVETPDGLIVKEGVSLTDCPALKKIGDANIHGMLRVVFCPRLHEVSNTLKANSLWIALCGNLASIPDTVQVARNVSITACHALTAIPWHHVNGHLRLMGCTGLQTLPSPMTVDGELDVSDTRGLELGDDVSASEIIARKCDGLTVSQRLRPVL